MYLSDCLQLVCVPQRIPSGTQREGKTLSEINCESDDDDHDEDGDDGLANEAFFSLVLSVDQMMFGPPLRKETEAHHEQVHTQTHTCL